MQCYNCSKNINGKSWLELSNILSVNEKGNEFYENKHICGYICYRRLSEKNKLPKNLWKHTVNKEDYKGLINPIIPKKREFQYLSFEEVNNLNEHDRENYFYQKDKQISLDPEILELRDEMYKEDEYTKSLEEYSSDSSFLDDY